MSQDAHEQASEKLSKEDLIDLFDGFDDDVSDLEEMLQSDSLPPLKELLPTTMNLVKQILNGYAAAMAKPTEEGDDLLEIFKTFVKGDPSLNAVRDNVRELVYYFNCLDMNREDALPQNPERIAVRTVRHIYFYLRTRAEQDKHIDQPCDD